MLNSMRGIVIASALSIQLISSSTNVSLLIIASRLCPSLTSSVLFNIALADDIVVE